MFSFEKQHIKSGISNVEKSANFKLINSKILLSKGNQNQDQKKGNSELNNTREKNHERYNNN